MIRRILALVIDFRTTAEARRLTCQLADAKQGGFMVTPVHVDNGNSYGVTLSPEQVSRDVRLLRVPHNGGYASGVRRAIQHLRLLGDHYDGFWILNSDMDVEPDCLQRLVAVLNSNPRVAAVGPSVRKGRTGRVWGDRGVVSPWKGTTAMEPWPEGGVLPRWSYVPGCSILVRAEAYDAVGGIPERYGMFYEETHLCVQLQKQGWDLWVEPSAVVYHKVNSMSSGIPAPYQAFYFARNNLYFWKTNFGIPALIQFPRTMYVVTRDLILPLRRARTVAEAVDRLRFVAMGLADGFSFRQRRYTHFERKHFELEPKPTSASGA